MGDLCYSLFEPDVIPVPKDKVQLSIATDLLRVKGVSYKRSEKEISEMRDHIAKAFAQAQPKATP